MRKKEMAERIELLELEKKKMMEIIVQIQCKVNKTPEPASAIPSLGSCRYDELRRKYRWYDKTFTDGL